MYALNAADLLSKHTNPKFSINKMTTDLYQQFRACFVLFMELVTWLLVRSTTQSSVHVFGVQFRTV